MMFDVFVFPIPRSSSYPSCLFLRLPRLSLLLKAFKMAELLGYHNNNCLDIILCTRVRVTYLNMNLQTFPYT